MTAKRPIKRIALVFPCQVTTRGYDIESVKRKGQFAEAPLGLAYISAFIKRFGYEVKIFDAHLMAVKGLALGTYSRLDEIEDELMSQIKEFSPDVVGISCLFHYTYRTAHRITGRIKREIKNVITVMGGAYPTISTDVALGDENIDFVVLGEGERAFLNLLEALNGRINFDGLKAVAYRDKEGQPVIKSECSLLVPLNEVPFPDRTDLALEDYYRYGRHTIQRFEDYEGQEIKVATLVATRGCVFNCSFCAAKKIWSGMRFRDSANVLDEMQWLKETYGIDHFSFNDDNLLINRKFACELLQGIIERKLNIRWMTGGMSIRGLNEEMIRLALESGCLIFNLAIESANEDTLAKIRKPVSAEEAIRAVEMIRKHKDAYIIGLFILGFPGETEEQVLETVRFGKSLQCDWTNYALLTPFPGSDIYDEAKAAGILLEEVDSDFEKLDFRNYVLRQEQLSPGFLEREAYFANLDQNFFDNPNLRRGKVEIALSGFKNTLQIAPTHATAYYCVGRIHEARGEKDLARQFYELASNNLSGLHRAYFEKLGIDLRSLSV